MRVIRVRCVDDGRELLLERHGTGEYSIQVAEIKEWVLQQRQQFQRNGDAVNLSNSQHSDLEDCFVLLRGRILADPDIVDLNALHTSDFFVFAPDSAQSDIDARFNGEMHKGEKDSGTFELLQSQLVDMGFSSELATRALQQSGNSLSDAVTLLAEGNVVSDFKDEVKTAVHPSIAPLGGVVNTGNVRKLQVLASTDSFQALSFLKDNFSSEMLNQLNENPVATLQLLSLPVQIPLTEMEQYTEEIIDLVAMGFARDLVEAMYESCGGDEQLTANALLQTLDS
ncbi:hypothetical protein P3T76_003357 [Phytophthora citrophthora]|uniref:UBA domain-containing protein n=1 Tax=Phytophthora citrophthora TaxID=4793 RepID=A0AAD9GUF6_9STRA|nr:hypothetical protein P3T76_003357 [Phytophthora citrophthora]